MKRSPESNNPEQPRKIGRREFLKTAAIAGAAAALAPETAATESEQKEIINGIIVEGSSEFIEKTKTALELLKGSSFDEIKKFLGRIRQAEYSGMDAKSAIPTYYAGEWTWKAPAHWYASTIAHDTLHSFLYHDYERKHKFQRVKSSAWMGAENEKKCLKFQLKILQEINGDIRDIKYVEELMKNPTYQDEYKNRYW